MTDAAHVNAELPWPARGAKLFRDDLPDWINNAWLPGRVDWRLYAEGYRRGARLLVEHVDRHSSDQDFLLYPVVFCYRQYLELKMKHLIREGNRLLDIDEDFKYTHDLLKLWEPCRSILEQVASEDASELTDLLDAVTEGIEQLCAMDPASEGFRYPEGKDGSQSLPGALRLVNLRHFGDQSEGLANLLDAAGDQISVHLDHKAEMRQYYR
jgi:hypothetical protein